MITVVDSVYMGLGELAVTVNVSVPQERFAKCLEACNRVLFRDTCRNDQNNKRKRLVGYRPVNSNTVMISLRVKNQADT